MKEESWSPSPIPDYYRHLHYIKVSHKFFKVHHKTSLLISTTPPERLFQKVPFLWSEIIRRFLLFFKSDDNCLPLCHHHPSA